MRIRTIGLSLLLLSSGAGLRANSQESATGVQAPWVVLREGTKVDLRFAQQVTFQRAKDGDPVELELAADLKIGDLVVAAKGARAIGVLVKTNEFHVEATALRVGETKVPLRGVLPIQELGANKIEQSKSIIQQDVPGLVVVAADTEIQWPNVEAGTAAIKKATGEAEIDVPADKIRVPNGTPLRVMLSDAVSSKKVRLGDLVSFRVLDDVRIGKLVVIRNGAPTYAVIAEAHAAGMAWRSGTLRISVESVEFVNGEKHLLEMQTSAKGGPTNAAMDWTNAIVGSYGLLLFALPLAPLQHGNQATIPKGTVFNVMLNGEVVLNRAEVEAHQPAVERKFGNASVTVFYQKAGNTPKVNVWCGVVKVGRIGRGEKFKLSIPPGTYSFRNSPKSNPVTVDAEEGGEYYLELSSREGTEGTWPGGMREAEHDVGALQSEGMKPVAAKDAPDAGKYTVEQLQSQQWPGKQKK